MCFFLILLFLPPSFAAPAEPVALATQLYTSAYAHYNAGNGALEDVYRWSVRWEALTGDQASKEAHRARMAALLTVATAHVAAGLAPPEDVLAAQFFLEEADGWLKK